MYLWKLELIVMGQTMFEVPCLIVRSQKDKHVQVCSMFEKTMFESVQFSKSSEGSIRFDVRSFEAKNRVFEFVH